MPLPDHEGIHVSDEQFWLFFAALTAGVISIPYLQESWRWSLQQRETHFPPHKTKKQAKACFLHYALKRSESNDVLSLRTFLALSHCELNFLAFSQSFET